MANRMTTEELEAAVVAAIAELGPKVEWGALTQHLNDVGAGQAIPLLRGMKHRGVISLRLERDGLDIGHYASLPE